MIFIFLFLDPVGSLVSTLWVVGCGLWVGHTFSKLVNFECWNVGMCWCVGVLVPLVPWKLWRLEECKIGRV